LPPPAGSRNAKRHAPLAVATRAGVACALLLCGLHAGAQQSTPAAPAQATSAAAGALNSEDTSERLVVAGPYLELHTGPGRGYPVTFVVARGEWVEIELRRTEWYRVRSAGGKTGWAHRSQLETTLTAAGQTKSFRDVLVDDYLQRRVEMGAAWGRFESAPMLKVWTSYRLTDTFTIEGTVGQVQGTFSGTNFAHLGINAEPWSEQRWSPYVGIGIGRLSNVPNKSLVDAVSTNANLAEATVGLRYYLSDRFVARIDYTLYTAYVSDTRSTEYRATTIGLSFFF
jgi:uncharacterized protein YgiM (DUF1202 family)